MDFVTLLPAIAGVLTAVGSLGGSYVLLRKAQQERGKIEAERKRIETETKSLAKKSDLDRAMALVDQLQEDNERLRSRLQEMDLRDERRFRDLVTLKTGILVLINQIRGLGVEPAWQPEWAAPCVEERDGH